MSETETYCERLRESLGDGAKVVVGTCENGVVSIGVRLDVMAVTGSVEDTSHLLFSKLFEAATKTAGAMHRPCKAKCKT